MSEKDSTGLYGRVDPPSGLLPNDRWRATRHAPNPEVARMRRQKRRNHKLGRWVLFIVIAVAIAFPVNSVVRSVKRWRAHDRQAAIQKDARLAVERELAPAPAQDRAVEQLIERAKEGEALIQEVLPMLDRRLFGEAKRKINAQLEKTPDRIDLQLVLASLYMQTAQWNEARDLLVRILLAEPEEPSGRRLLAQACQQMEKFDEAYLLALWILEREPGNADGLRIASSASLSAGEYARAIPHIRALLERVPDDLLARQYLAIAYLRLGQYSRAVEKFSELIRTSPGEPENHYNLAVCYAQQGNVEDTVEALQRALSNVPQATVRIWLAEKDFSLVQQDALMRVFLAELGSAPVSAITAQARPDAGVGLMPQAPRIDLRAIDFRK